jgi:trimeric autotransporter adhesin
MPAAQTALMDVDATVIGRMRRLASVLLAGMLVSCGGGGSDGASTSSSGGTGGSGSGDVTQDAPPPAAGRYEESHAAVSLGAGWTPSDAGSFAWSGGAAVQATAAGTQATFRFSGTSVTWIGTRNINSGIALVKVDGGPVIEVDLFALPEVIRTPIIALHGLSPGSHTLAIEVTGRKHPTALSNVIQVDAFDVQAPVVSHIQETDPDVVFSAGWVQAEDTFSWSGGGVFTHGEPVVGGAKVADTPGAKVTLTFRGTSISWSGYRGPDAGIARVQVDSGVAVEVDTYSPTHRVQDIVFTAQGLADTSHTLTIEATGGRNDASAGARIVVDAFDVRAPGTRFQENHPALAYSGDWIHGNVNRTWSEGSASTSDPNGTAGARVTFTFTGTSVSWIGLRKHTTGIARVFLDGNFVRDINTYEPTPIEGYQHTVFRADGLTPGTHTLTLESASSGGFLVVDAFDVRP